MDDPLKKAKEKAAATYDAAADHFDDEPLSFWDRVGKRTVANLKLHAGAKSPRRWLWNWGFGIARCPSCRKERICSGRTDTGFFGGSNRLVRNVLRPNVRSRSGH